MGYGTVHRKRAGRQAGPLHGIHQSASRRQRGVDAQLLVLLLGTVLRGDLRDRRRLRDTECQLPGQFGSNTDFGFNGNGIGFNETTHVDLYDKPRTAGIWLTYRSAAAEQFARSIDEFYEYCKLDNTGTYLNGYQLVDANTGEIGLIDMSYNRFVLFKCDGKKMDIVDSTGYKPNHLDYDHHLIFTKPYFRESTSRYRGG